MRVNYLVGTKARSVVNNPPRPHRATVLSPEVEERVMNPTWWRVWLGVGLRIPLWTGHSLGEVVHEFS